MKPLAAALLCGCAGGPPPAPAPVPLSAVLAALEDGDLKRAHAIVGGARAQQPLAGSPRVWEAWLARLEGRDDDALDWLQSALRTADRGDLPPGELEGRIGMLLYELGRRSDALPYLRAGRVGPEAERRAAFATMSLQAGDAQTPPGDAAAELPLRLEGLPELICGMNGVERPLVLDTGASFTTLTDSLAREVGVQPLRPAGESRDGVGNAFAVRAGLLRQFTLGNLALGDLPVLVVEDQRLALRDPFQSPPRRPGGIVGLDVLSRFRITFDPARHSVLLGARGSLPAAESVHCLRSDGALLAPVRIENRDLWFVFDTGASHSSLTEAGVERLPGGIERAVPTHRRIVSPGGTGFAVREVKDLTLEVTGTRFTGVALPVIRRPAGLFPLHGVLGADLLLRARVSIDGVRLRIEAR
jgi:predicted aspartyl protease